MKPHLQPEIVGSAQLRSLIDVIRNVDQYDAKLRALEDMRAEVNKLVEAYGAIGEINDARHQATIDRTTAQEMLAKAKVRADELVTQAQQAAAEMRAEAEAFAKQTIDGSKAEVASLRDEAKATVAVAKKREAEASKALLTAESMQTAAQESIRCAKELEAKAEAARQEYVQLRAKLERALGE